jgi:hypothetical protein
MFVFGAEMNVEIWAADGGSDLTVMDRLNGMKKQRLVYNDNSCH